MSTAARNGDISVAELRPEMSSHFRW